MSIPELESQINRKKLLFCKVTFLEYRIISVSNLEMNETDYHNVEWMTLKVYCEMFKQFMCYNLFVYFKIL